jgi:hypothetical protein
MTLRGRAARLPGVVALDRRIFTLELEPAAEPIAGLLREPGGAEHEFHGWLGLAGALERAIEHDSRQSPRASEGSG